MDKKDVTPKASKGSGVLKKFGIGFLGGIVGAAIVSGGLFFALGNNSTSSSTASGSSTAGKEAVSNVTVDVNSGITDAVKKVQDSVVSVINLQTYQQSNPWGSLFGQEDSGTTASSDGDLEEAGSGSGAIYKIEGNTAYIVTNNHVVADQDGLEVLLSDGTRVTATLVGTDSYTDLAVIKITSDAVKDIKAATFGDSDKLTVGETALAIGSPLGTEYANSVTAGIVSSVNRQVVNTSDGENSVTLNAIQTDAAINPGNSGGPLVNIDGQIIGINSSKIVQTESDVSVEGMGFAIPSNEVVSIINKLETDGKVTRPALGITMGNLSQLTSSQIDQYLKIPDSVTNGVVVGSVYSGTPAATAGLKQYDVITEIDGEEITSYIDLQSKLYQLAIGDTMKLTVYRGSDKQTISVKLTMTSAELDSLQGNSSSSDNSGNSQNDNSQNGSNQ